MVRLITLKLQPAPRPAKQSTLPPSSNAAPPPIPARSPRRAETVMAPVLNLPQTQRQWRVALDEVRNSYLTRQYRQCSTRCIQLLEGAPDMVLTFHCIYLSFYAAISLELLARALPNSSCQKLSTFNLARSYYEKAAHYMWDIDYGHIFPKLELGCKNSLAFHHHVNSLSSESSGISEKSSAASSPTLYTFSPPLHSPASSICSSFSKSEGESSFDCLKPQPLRVKKSVTFRLDCPEPVQNGINSTPNDVIIPNTSLSEVLDISSKPDDRFARFNIHLSPLRTQVIRHLSSITYLISTLEESLRDNQPSSPSHPPSTIPSPMSNQEIYPHPSLSLASNTTNSQEDDRYDVAQLQQEKRAQARIARIAALKHRGEEWKHGRGRFDAKRYERLCDEALRELYGRQSESY